MLIGSPNAFAPLERAVPADASHRSPAWRGASGPLGDQRCCDLAAVDPFEGDAGDPEIRVSELALDGVHGDALAGHIGGESMAQLRTA